MTRHLDSLMAGHSPAAEQAEDLGHSALQSVFLDFFPYKANMSTNTCEQNAFLFFLYCAQGESHVRQNLALLC